MVLVGSGTWAVNGRMARRRGDGCVLVGFPALLLCIGSVWHTGMARYGTSMICISIVIPL